MTLNEYSLLACSPIEVDTQPTRPDRRGLFLNVGSFATFGGEIKDETPTVIEPDALWVEPWMRGHGVGERLVRALVEESRKLGIETIRGHLESEYALDIRERVFGEKALRFFYDYTDGTPEEFPEQYAELPISFDQARQSLVRASEFEDNLDYRMIGFDVEVDISYFDAK